MEKGNTQGSGDGHPRVHDDNRQGAGHPRVRDYDGQGEEQRRDDYGGSPRGSRVRFMDEKGEHRGDGAQQKANEAGTDLEPFARAWTDPGSVAFGGTGAHLILFWQQQLAGFFSMRVNKDLQFGERLLGVRDLNDWGRLNSDYLREMVFDYTAGVCNIMEQSVKQLQHSSQ